MKSHTNNNKESDQQRSNGVSDMGGVGGIGENEPNILVEEEEPTTTTTSGSRKSRKHSSSGDESGAASDNENEMAGDENDNTLNNNHNSVENGEGASDGETQEDEADAKLDATTGSSGHNDSQLNNDDDSK